MNKNKIAAWGLGGLLGMGSLTAYALPPPGLQAIEQTQPRQEFQIETALQRCEHGDASACYLAAFVVVYAGLAVPPPSLEAACESPHLDACYLAAWRAQYAQPPYLVPDLAYAAQLYEAACALDHAEACNEAGTLARNAGRDPHIVTSLYEAACTLGRPEGCKNLQEYQQENP